MPEWPKGTGCKPVGSAYGGSNPPAPISAGTSGRATRGHDDVPAIGFDSTRRWTHRLDSVLLHPIAGPIILLAVLFVMFQSVFAWSQVPVGWSEAGMAWLGDAAANA